MKKVISVILSALILTSVSGIGSLSASAVGEKCPPVASGNYVESGNYGDFSTIEKMTFDFNGENPQSGLSFWEAASLEQNHFVNCYKTLNDKKLETQIKEDYINSLNLSSELNVEDITVKYYGTLSDGTMLLNINGPFGYLQAMNVTVLGKYVYIQYDSNQYNIYKDGKFYTLYDLYSTEELNDKLLDETADYLNFVQFSEDNMILSGDADENGIINISDATMIQKVVAEIERSDAPSALMDADCDGKVSITDATAIQKYSADIK